jgi:hypothetical protein
VKSSTNWHSEWLISQHSANGCQHGCRDYHLLAPVLHSLGHFLSFERYGPEIRAIFDMVAKTASGAPRVLVVGAESDESLGALVATLVPRDCKIDVIDRCATPLSRIVAARETGDPEIRTIQSDIFAFASDVPYDMVIADSFLKQIAPEQRVAAVQRIAAALRPAGIAVLREYIGAHTDLLADFWSKLQTRLREVRWHDQACSTAQLILQDRLPALQAYMVSSGGAYETVVAMTGDLRAGGLMLILEEAARDLPYIIAFCRRAP